MQGIFERASDQQNDQHLHHFSKKGNRAGRERAEDFIRSPAFNQNAVHQPAEQSFNDGGNHTAQRGHAAQRVAMKAAGQSHQAADHRSAQQAAHHRADGSRIGDRIFDMQAKVGAEDAENREGHVAQELMR